MGNTTRLGRTNIIVNKNGFGALPIQRISKPEAGKLLRKAYDNGITFFDTARAYSDSEEKIGLYLSDVRKDIYISTKTHAATVEDFWDHLHTSLKLLKTDYIDIYQLHNPAYCPKPNDDMGIYDSLLKAKDQGKIRFIGITNHRLAVAQEAVDSGLYDTLQFPFSYMSGEQELSLVKACEQKDMGYIAMKALCGGLITNSAAAYAFVSQYDNVLPIWGVQKENELDEFISYVNNPPVMDEAIKAVIKADNDRLAGDFCRGCGYCLPCPAGIEIFTCARMSLLIRRAPSAQFLTEKSQEMMGRIKDCIHCNACKTRCPYDLDTPKLLQENYKDYLSILDGRTTV